MRREPINPWEWSTKFGFSQAVEVSGFHRLLVCSAQTAVDEQAAPPASDGMESQGRAAFENLRTVLAEDGMSTDDIVKLTYYTTDVDGFRAVLRPLRAEFLGGQQVAETLIGVTRLALPELKIAIEALAAR
ncbi:MAG TPA: Rid family hydrolase [Actinomycetota bacterium]|nr:Rid family hydrolase [Actinomycetota bacterium]